MASEHLSSNSVHHWVVRCEQISAILPPPICSCQGVLFPPPLEVVFRARKTVQISKR